MRDPPPILPDKPDHLHRLRVEVRVGDEHRGHEQHPPRHVFDEPPRPVHAVDGDHRLDRVLADRIDGGELQHLLARTGPEGVRRIVAALGRLAVLLVGVAKDLADAVRPGSPAGRADADTPRRGCSRVRFG